MFRFSSVKNETRYFELQTAICFFTSKHKILKTVPMQSFVFYNDIQNSGSCTQMAIIISLKEMRNLTIYHQCMYPSGHSFVYREIRNFTVVSKQPFVFYSEIQNSTVVLKRPLVFHSEIRNLELYPSGHSFFDYEIRSFLSCCERSIYFLTTNANKLPFVF